VTSPVIEHYLAHLVDVVEGPKYTDKPNDKGGPTKYGVTLKALSHHRGHPCTAEDVQNLQRDEALEIARDEYVQAPGFDKVAEVSTPVGLECIDTGYNAGPHMATTFLQRSLNVLNDQGRLWQDLHVDGACGAKTLDALRALIRTRSVRGLRALLLALNCRQGDYYMSIAESDPTQEDWVFGWFNQRIQLVPDIAFYGALK
jgi:lysozyme family protein